MHTIQIASNSRAPEIMKRGISAVITLSLALFTFSAAGQGLTAREIIQNVKYILAIELMAGLQALDFYELRTSKILEKIKACVRKKVPFLQKDARLDVHFKEIVGMIQNDSLLNIARDLK